jgi:hypothetical protein
VAEKEPGSMLVLVAALLQIGFIVYFAILFFIVPDLLSSIYGLDPASPLLNMLVTMSRGIYILLISVGIPLTILWFMWRSKPTKHYLHLIVSGIIGLFFAGIVPGLIVILAGFKSSW